LEGPKKGARYGLHIKPLEQGVELEGRQFYLKLPVRSLEADPGGTIIWVFQGVLSETPTKVTPIVTLNKDFWEWYQKQNKEP
jgi:hypothetical protein